MKTHMTFIDETGTEVKLCDFLLTDQELTRNWKEVTCKKCLKKRINPKILKWSCLECRYVDKGTNYFKCKTCDEKLSNLKPANKDK